MLSIAIVSSWHVHTNDYARQIKANDKARIVAMWDEDPVRGAEWAAVSGVEFVADYDALLARSDIDAIVCNSPTTMHRSCWEKRRARASTSSRKNCWPPIPPRAKSSARS